jgi:uncharacterized protein (TIGR00255 family)
MKKSSKTADSRKADTPASLAKNGKVRSMTGFARGTIQVRAGLHATLTFKSVNHRFLDVQIRLPNGMDALEIPLRNAIKQSIARGHVDVFLQIERESRGGFEFNLEAIRSYVGAFQAAAAQEKLKGEPDLNAIFRLPGVISNDGTLAESDAAALEAAVVKHAAKLLQELNTMRAQEGAALAAELRQTMQNLDDAVQQASDLRETARQMRFERMQQRIAELTQGTVDQDRILQEAALIADRADIEEEIVRLRTHVQHFLEVLDSGAETGKKLDFLLQEMNREANTLLSKTSGTAGNALRITEIGLAIKGGVEKTREQIQNLE